MYLQCNNPVSSYRDAFKRNLAPVMHSNGIALRYAYNFGRLSAARPPSAAELTESGTQGALSSKGLNGCSNRSQILCLEGRRVTAMLW